MKAYELLQNEARWCRGSLARQAGGQPCMLYASHAKQWCALGALVKCYPLEEPRLRVITKLLGYLGDGNKGIVHWNDNTDYATVHAALRKLDL